MQNNHTFSIVVETENLGMAGFEDLERSLDSIKSQTYPLEKIVEVLLIAGGHLSPEVVKKLRKQYPWLRIHVEPSELDYARSKMKGAEVAKGSVVLFADSDMRYQRSWLKNMITTLLTSPPGTVVSGDTRLETISAYSMALNCTWMIQILSDAITGPVPTQFFPLNNFAIERAAMLSIPIPYTLPLYRNKIPLWEAMLVHSGYTIVRAPGSRGYHAPPPTLADWWYRMLIYGADFVAQADFRVTDGGKVVEKKDVMRRIGRLLLLAPWKVEQLVLNSFKLLREDIGRAKYMPGALVIGLANCFVATLGACIACCSRDFVFNKINAREGIHIV